MSAWRIVSQEMSERVDRALGLVPARVFEHVGGVPAMFEGDIRFAGVADLDPASAYCHWSRDSTWISLPRVRPHAMCDDGWPDVYTVLHELGHALHAKWLLPACERRRVYWSIHYQEVRVRYGHTGLIPPMQWPTRHGIPLAEAFADAFAVWLLPTEDLHRDWHTLEDAGRFYATYPRAPLADWGWRVDNRFLLAMFNELAGFPLDTPPRALR